MEYGKNRGFWHRDANGEMLSSMCTLLRRIGLSNTQAIELAEKFHTTSFSGKIGVLHNKALLKLKIPDFHRTCKEVV